MTVWGVSGASGIAEPSGSINAGGIVFTSANWLAAYSINSGTSFNQLNPTTIFPNDAVGYCCDQVVQYAPTIDRFIWLLQGNGVRLAVATPAQVKNSSGTGWTYWNLTPDLFGATGFDYPDLSIGDKYLYMSWNASAKVSGHMGGAHVIRRPAGRRSNHHRVHESRRRSDGVVRPPGAKHWK